jgi:hypothetical protein
MGAHSLEVDRQLLEIDAGRFRTDFAKEPMSIKHSLADHPLLSLEAIAELADELPGSAVERHQANLPVFMPGGAPELSGPPAETVLGIETNNCWMVLWDIERVTRYHELLDACVDEAQALFGPDVRGGAIQRRAFLFLSAPDATTPAHIDAEHNLLLQIRGVKDMHIGRFNDPADQVRELDRLHDGGHRNLEKLPEHFDLYRMHPGDGVYVYPFAPHWVKNGPAASMSLSITFRTEASAQAERLHRFNARMRKLHLSPKPAGMSRTGDAAKLALMEAIRKVKPSRSTGPHR